MKYSRTLEKFLSANRGELIWVFLKESNDTILGRLEEYEENILVLNIVEQVGDNLDVTEVLLLLDLESIFGFTAGAKGFEVFKKAVEKGRQAEEALMHRSVDGREIA